jgi:hypothetical protein
VNAGMANDTSRARVRDRTRQLQRALYQAAKASPTRRFHAFYDKVYDREILWSAWGVVRANRGALGIDGETIEAIEQRGIANFLAELRGGIAAGDVPSSASAPGGHPQGVRRGPAIGYLHGARSGGVACGPFDPVADP